MSAPVEDVLLEIRSTAQFLADDGWRERAEALRAAGAAVTELIEADKDLDAANAALRRAHPPGTNLSVRHPLVVRVVRAERRRTTALASVQGAK